MLQRSLHPNIDDDVALVHLYLLLVNVAALANTNHSQVDVPTLINILALHMNATLVECVV